MSDIDTSAVTEPKLRIPGEDRTIVYRDVDRFKSELVRTFSRFDSTFPLKNPKQLLHRVLQENELYAEMLDAFNEVIQEFIEELVHTKVASKNPFLYLNGEHYETELRDLALALNHSPDYFLAPLMFDSQDKTAEWMKFDTLSVAFDHRNRVSALVYSFIFSRIWRHGGVFLEVQYPAGQDTLNTFTQKAVRLVDNSNALSEFVPPQGAQWPRVGCIEGFTSYADFTDLFAFRFDLGGNQFDTGITYSGDIEEDAIDPETGEPYSYTIDADPTLHFDGQTFPLVKDRSLILSMTLDRVLFLAENTLHTDPVHCLQDIPFLQYVERNAQKNKKITEHVKIGSQLTLACDTSGFYVKSPDSSHSIPDIKADVIVIPSNYEENSEIARIRLGTGRVSGVLRDVLFRTPSSFQKVATYGTSSIYDESIYSGRAYDKQSTVDTDGSESEGVSAADRERIEDFSMIQPVFSTVVGEYETLPLTSSIQAINTLVEKQDLVGLSPAFELISPEDPDLDSPDDAISSLNVPHEYITSGTYEGILDLEVLYVRIGASEIDITESMRTVDTRYIPRDAFLFPVSSTDPPYDINSRLLYDFETLSFFGMEKETEPETSADIQASWEALAERIDTDSDYLWIFRDLTAPDESDTLQDVVLAAYNAGDTDIQSTVMTYLGSTDADYIQDWLSEEILVEFYPVGDYDADGKAIRVASDDAIDGSRINWRVGTWAHREWYSYAPQFTWRIYAKIEEALDSTTGWYTKAEHITFNDYTFREALRFFGEEVTETTTPDDYTPDRRLEILEQFFLSLTNGGVYAGSTSINNDPWNESLQFPYDSFFDRMWTGGMLTVPKAVLYNHRAIDPTYEYTVTESNGIETTETGVRLDTDKGILAFRLRMKEDTIPAGDEHIFVSPTLQTSDDNTVDERRPLDSRSAIMRVRYITNTTKNFADPEDISSQIVGIREVGIFNSEDKLIAYATFPPIIYDSYKNHLAINWYISDTEFISP